MTREDIIRMAREAGCLGPGAGGNPYDLWEPNGEENVTELMFCFAALVAAAEREACAKLCEALHYEVDAYGAQCAAAIRAMGNT
jgi:hypothetical protein